MPARFQPPTPAEVESYAASIGFKIDGGYFIDYWEARGWKLKAGVSMVSWQATVRNWKRMDDARHSGSQPLAISPEEEKKRAAAKRRLQIIQEAAARIVALRSWIEAGEACPYSKNPQEEIDREKDKISDHFGPKGLEDLRKAVIEIKRNGMK